MKLERVRRIAYQIEGEEESDNVDLMADRNLVRISLWEIFAIQLIAAIVFFLDFSLLPIPFGWLIFPLSITVWGAFRLRKFPFLTWVNAFTIGIVSFTLALGVYSTAAIWHESWRPVFRPDDLLAILGITFLAGPIGGCILGFAALFVVKLWSSWFEEQPADD